jgi:hypothetical protein
MNDLQLYEYYKTIPLASIGHHSRIYPKYVVITGRSFCYPHPHRYFTFEEFVDKLYSDPNFRTVINQYK